MTGSTFNRLLLEAGAVAVNHASLPHRIAAAREVASIDVFEIVGCGEWDAHLASAIRSAVIALATLSTDAARADAADGIKALVKAARATSTKSANLPIMEPRRYWIER